MGHFYNGIKKKNFILWDKMDGPGEHYANWDKPVRERQIPYDFTHMWKESNEKNWTNKENGDRLIDREQNDSWLAG